MAKNQTQRVWDPSPYSAPRGPEPGSAHPINLAHTECQLPCERLLWEVTGNCVQLRQGGLPYSLLIDQVAFQSLIWWQWGFFSNHVPGLIPSGTASLVSSNSLTGNLHLSGVEAAQWNLLDLRNKLFYILGRTSCGLLPASGAPLSTYS